jgi:outer membrane receptor for ferrienterochelin and colicins
MGYYAHFDNALTISSVEAPATVEDTVQQYGQATATYTRPFLANHDLTVVGEGIAERYEADRLNRTKAERFRAAIAVQDEWRITKEIQVIGGIRVDHDTQFGTHPTPKIALRFDPLDKLVLRASYGMGFRAPDFKELYLEFNTPNSNIVVRGNDALEAETSHGFNAGVEANLGVVSMSVTGFRNDISNLILVRPVATGLPETPTDFLYQNVAEARTQGVESTLIVRPHSSLRLGFGYMYTDAQDREEDRKLEGRPAHRGHTTITYAPDFGFEGTVGLALVGSRVYYESQSGAEDLEVNTDPYAMLDVRLAQQLPWDFKVFGGVRNALDAGDVTYLSITPRTFYAGLSAEFQ